MSKIKRRVGRGVGSSSLVSAAIVRMRDVPKVTTSGKLADDIVSSLRLHGGVMLLHSHGVEPERMTAEELELYQRSRRPIVKQVTAGELVLLELLPRLKRVGLKTVYLESLPGTLAALLRNRRHVEGRFPLGHGFTENRTLLMLQLLDKARALGIEIVEVDTEMSKEYPNFYERVFARDAHMATKIEKYQRETGGGKYIVLAGFLHANLAATLKVPFLNLSRQFAGKSPKELMDLEISTPLAQHEKNHRELAELTAKGRRRTPREESTYQLLLANKTPERFREYYELIADRCSGTYGVDATIDHAALAYAPGCCEYTSVALVVGLAAYAAAWYFGAEVPTLG